MKLSELDKIRKRMKEAYNTCLLVGVEELELEDFSYKVSDSGDIVITKVSEHLLSEDGTTMTIPPMITAMKLSTYEGLTPEQVEKLEVLDLNQVRVVYNNIYDSTLISDIGVFDNLKKIVGEKAEYFDRYAFGSSKLSSVYLPSLRGLGIYSLGLAELSEYYLPNLVKSAGGLCFSTSLDKVVLEKFALENRNIVPLRGRGAEGEKGVALEVDTIHSSGTLPRVMSLKANKTKAFYKNFYSRTVERSKRERLLGSVRGKNAYLGEENSYMKVLSLGELSLTGTLGHYVTGYYTNSNTPIMEVLELYYKETGIFELMTDMQDKFRQILASNVLRTVGDKEFSESMYLLPLELHNNIYLANWDYLSFHLGESLKGTKVESVYIEFYTRLAEIKGAKFEYK